MNNLTGTGGPKGLNPMQLMQMLRSGGNPQAILTQLANANPNFKNILNNLNGKSPQEMRQYAENLAQERGVKLEDIASKMGINLPK